MAIAPCVRDRIEREIQAWLEHPVDDPEFVAVVRRLRAWPVYSDMGGTLLIDVDGEVHGLDHDTMEVGPGPDVSWKTAAWVHAARKVPEIREALPARSADAIDCPDCGGQGTIQVTSGVRLDCGRCWGLGWLRPPDGREGPAR